MGLNYFIGWSQADLETELRAAQEDLAAGKTSISAGSGDANSASRVEKSCEERIRLILQALNKLAPDVYPSEDITPITETRISFS